MSSARSSARAVVRRLPGRARIVSRGPGSRPGVALTFDDGPSPWTAAIAAALEAHGCRGTFFVLGAAVQRDPQTVAALAAAGHELGNHLWGHHDPAGQSRAELRGEIERTAQAIHAAAGVRPTLVRPPYCGAPDRVARAAGGGVVVLRSVDPADWSAASDETIVARVLEAAGPGDVVCLHDGVAPRNRGTDSRAPTVAAVVRLVPALLERGLRPVTVSELLR
ncbi:MAG: peptidoglycan-N-acetylglucosamine deacetylase [Solirubrobacteraceae bacterium]|nr:peptidoglycan-N-acetylglucosamine deacetylase [Solirubrobacteraceae bacterium]